MTAPVAFADPGNKNFIPPGQAKKLLGFSDLTDYDWAWDSISFLADKGILKGEGYGLFSPQRSAKEIEVLVMLIRMLDLEEEIENNPGKYDDLPDEYEGGKPADWMIPYIALAWDEGLLNKDNIDDLQPNSSASREEAAMLILTALEGDDDYDDVLDELDEWFEDDDEISNKYGWHVYKIKKWGFMIGYQNKFQPKKSLSRAECAVLMHRIFNNYDFNYSYGSYDDTFLGELINLDYDGSDLDSLRIKDGSDYETFENFEDKVTILAANNCDNDADDKIDELEGDKHEGLKVKVFLDNEYVEKILVYYDTLEGEIAIERSQTDEYAYIVPENDNDPIKYFFDDDIQIFINGRERDEDYYDAYEFDDDKDYIVEGRLLDNKELIGLCITSEDIDDNEEDYIFSGVIKDIDLDGNDFEKISLEDDEDDMHHFIDFDNDLDIMVVNNCHDDAEDELDILHNKHEGLEAEIKVVDGDVTRIRIKYDQLEGRLDTEENQEHDYAMINPDGSEGTRKFNFDEDVEIFMNGEDITVTAFDNFNMIDTTVYDVEARLLGNGDIISMCIEYDDEKTDYEGRLISFTKVNEELILIEVRIDGEKEEFDVEDSCDVLDHEGDSTELTSEFVDETIEFTTNEDDKAIEIRLPDLD